MVVNLLYRLVIVYVKDSILIHSGVETSGNKTGAQITKNSQKFLGNKKLQGKSFSKYLNVYTSRWLTIRVNWYYCIGSCIIRNT